MRHRLKEVSKIALNIQIKFNPNIGIKCPPKLNVRELNEDLGQFARRLRIKEYFHSKKETSEDLSTDESHSLYLLV
jgi:hypothetical protein